jgi:ABC-type antimicrobial peptide transport system permease subunit
VAQRRQEIGIRAAVGASGPDTVLLVVGEGMRMVGLGAVAGLLGSWALGRVLRGLLFEVAPADPLTFAGVVVLLSLVALAASVVPAVRAVRVSPLEALRAD